MKVGRRYLDRRAMSLRMCLALATCAAALAQAPVASAGPYIEWASKTRAHVGELVRVRAGAGLRLYELMPLYLVAVTRAPWEYPCGKNTLCSLVAPRTPRGGIYHRIGTLNVRHRKEVTITYRVPRLAPGRYVYVIYCGPCWRGPGGSLLPWRRPSLTVIR